MNALAAFVMLVFLRDGLPGGGNDLAARAAYVDSHVVAWRLSWLVWNAAALSLLAFFLALAMQWWSVAPLRCAFAVLVAAAGVAADVSAEAMLMMAAPSDLLSVERLAIPLTGCVGNGLYTIAGIALTSTGVLPRRLVALGALVWGAGIALSASTVAGSVGGQMASTAVVMPLFVIWSIFVGLWLRNHAS